MPGSPLQHGMDVPCDGEGGAERIQAEFAVDVLAHRVVDAGDHARHLEDFTGDLRGHDVPVVAIGQGGEAVRRFDAGLAKHVLVDPVAEHHLAGEVVTEPVERPAVAVDDGDPVASFGKGNGGHRAYTAATNDDELHELKPHSRHYRPRASRAASTSGSPAARILAWVVAMSYGTRSKRTAGRLRSTTAKAASGLPSRGWPTLPGLTKADDGTSIQSVPSGICSPLSVKIRGKWVCPKKQYRVPRRTRISRACSSSRMYSQMYGLRGLPWTSR